MLTLRSMAQALAVYSTYKLMAMAKITPGLG